MAKVFKLDNIFEQVAGISFFSPEWGNASYSLGIEEKMNLLQGIFFSRSL